MPAIKLKKSDIIGPPGPPGRDGRDGTDASEIIRHTQEQTAVMVGLINKLAEMNEKQLNNLLKGMKKEEVKHPKRFIINRDDDGLIQTIDVEM